MGEVDRQDRGRARVALDDGPAMAARAVIPELAMGPGGVVPQMDVLEEPLAGVGRGGVGTRPGGISQIGEFVHVALAAERASDAHARKPRSEEHTSELQSLMRISYAVFCLKKKKNQTRNHEDYKIIPATIEN